MVEHFAPRGHHPDGCGSKHAAHHARWHYAHGAGVLGFSACGVFGAHTMPDSRACCTGEALMYAHDFYIALANGLSAVLLGAEVITLWLRWRKVSTVQKKKALR